MPDSNDAHSKQAQADDELIVRYFDGQLDTAGVAALNDRLKVEPALRHRLIDLSLQTHYISALVGKPDLALVQDELLNLQSGRASLKFSVPTSYRIGFAAASAAVLALAVTLMVVLSGSEPANPTTDLAQVPDVITTPDEPATRAKTVATLTASHNAQWAEGAFTPRSTLRAGDRLTLTAGFAEITTSHGAVAIVEGPAAIELLGSNALRLNTGKLVGICETESSKGFFVRTPHMDITDIGTQFGVQVDETVTRTRVLTGEIEVRSASAEQGLLPTRLTAGESTKAYAGLPAVEQDNASGLSFVCELPVRDTVPRIQGAARFESALPMRLGNNQTQSDQIVIFLEKSDTRLASDVQVTIDRPGSYASYINRQATVPKGTKVQSYLVHFDSLDNTVNTERRQAMISFARPVLGIIATGEQMSRANELLGFEGVIYASPPSSPPGSKQHNTGLDEIRDIPNRNTGDFLVLSEDRKTLSLDLYSSKQSDQIRVLVLAED